MQLNPQELKEMVFDTSIIDYDLITLFLTNGAFPDNSKYQESLDALRKHRFMAYHGLTVEVEKGTETLLNSFQIEG